MLTSKKVCEIAESLSGVTKKDHFGSDAYYANGRTFATVWHEKNEVNLRLTPEEQRRFLLLDGEGFAEIDNAWGRQGWTNVQLEFVEPEAFLEALKSAWGRLDGEAVPLKRKSKTKKKARSKKK